jgi:hypothetical protein
MPFGRSAEAATLRTTWPQRGVPEGGVQLAVDVADSLTAELLTAVDQTVQPTRSSLWLRP